VPKYNIVNICSSIAGSYSPMHNAWCNCAHDKNSNSLLIYFSNGRECYQTEKTAVKEFLLSRNRGQHFVTHIMYEPGRDYPNLEQTGLSIDILRIGDVHHLSNPLSLAYGYISRCKPKNVYFNTTPHWVSLFKALGIQTVFWSDLSESARFSHRLLAVDIEEKFDRPLKIGYIGNLLSKTHVRRSWFVNSILRQGIDIYTYPFGNHANWFKYLSELHYVICPTLNAQISHNLFTPMFFGCCVLTDHVAFPSPLAVGDLPIIEFSGPNQMASFLVNDHLKLLWHDYYSTATLRNKLLQLDASHGNYDPEDPFMHLETIRNKGEAMSSIGINPQISEAEYLTPLLILNIIEIIQELHRLTAHYIHINAYTKSNFFLFDTVITLPRVKVYRKTLLPRSNSSSLKITFYGGAIKRSLLMTWRLPSATSDDIISSDYVCEKVFQLTDFGKYFFYPQKVHKLLSLSIIDNYD